VSPAPRGPAEAYPMLPPATALEIVLQHARPLEAEEVEAADALGRVLAADVRSEEDYPAAPRSSVDGYAVRAADREPRRRVIGEVTAGHPSAVEVGPGTAQRIMTGGVVPPGADAVVMIEDTRDGDGVVELLKPVAPGQCIHPTGMDIQRGQVILPAGTAIGPAEIGLLATIGRVRVPVHRRPRVAVLSTGDEVVEWTEQPGPGQVRDSNRPALIAAVREAGGVPISLGRALDREEDQRALITRGAREADVVITSGGVSMGARDLIKPILAQLGTVHVGRINFKPGKPLTFATIDSTLVFGLPGFPVSSLVTFEVFVRPALRALQGFAQVTRPEVPVVLEHEVKPDPVRPEYQRAIVRVVGGELRATTTGAQTSSRLLSMVGANALLKIAPGSEPLPAGARVPALLIGEPRHG
jgi:molybdopterin molybdotransferase